MTMQTKKKRKQNHTRHSVNDSVQFSSAPQTNTKHHRYPPPFQHARQCRGIQPLYAKSITSSQPASALPISPPFRNLQRSMLPSRPLTFKKRGQMCFLLCSEHARGARGPILVGKGSMSGMCPGTCAWLQCGETATTWASAPVDGSIWRDSCACDRCHR